MVELVALFLRKSAFVGFFVFVASSPVLADSVLSNVLVCTSSNDGSTVAPCSAGQVPSVLSGYVLSSVDYSSFQVVSGPFDPVQGAAYFAFGLGCVLSTWIISFGIGLCLQLVKNA